MHVQRVASKGVGKRLVHRGDVIDNCARDGNGRQNKKRVKEVSLSLSLSLSLSRICLTLSILLGVF